jgi:hypothetical protein
MKNTKLLPLYEIQVEDWSNMTLVEMKMKAESIVSLFMVMENISAPHITPVESDAMRNARDRILRCFDSHIKELIDQ